MDVFCMAGNLNSQATWLMVKSCKLWSHDHGEGISTGNLRWIWRVQLL